MFKKILIANRGEIACRVIKTARRMGISTVAVYSDADARAPFVAMADEAVHIGASPASESYLIADKIIAACKATGAEAVHPGYGFLSERTSFAEALAAENIAFIGPPVGAIAAMGDKIESKKLAKEAGVNVVPGFVGEIRDTEHAVEISNEIGYPVMMKASAGGGGKGMRLAYDEKDVREGFEATKREGLNSFGDDRVFIEKFILNPRHIEIQILGDQHGNILYLNERECSIQRRHQKVVEEAPSPFVTPKMRKAMGEQCVALAKAVGYYSAGTVELIVSGADPTGESFYFLEMNTRLQVEHPVTEEITGVDLVEWQLRVASGEPLPLTQDDLSINGWAMEARLYAEDPAKGFLPSIGTLELFQLPEHLGRVDAGVYEGAEVSPFYDPMIAKVIAYGEDREEARAMLSEMLEDSAIWPVRTNSAFLIAALDHPDFVAGTVDTGLIGRDGDAMTAEPEPSVQALTNAAMAMTPRSLQSGFRLNAPDVRDAPFLLDGKRVDVTLHGPGTDEPAPAMLVAESGSVWQLSPWRAEGGGGGAASDGAILSPMPGKVIAVDVAAGDRVAKGQKLLTLEAMKMEHSLTAPFDGVVAELNAVAGGQVQVEALLVRIEKEEA